MFTSNCRNDTEIEIPNRKRKCNFLFTVLDDSPKKKKHRSKRKHDRREKEKNANDSVTNENDNVKDATNEDVSNREVSNRDVTDREVTNQDASNQEATNQQVSNQEVTNGEASNDNVVEEPVVSPKTPEQPHNSINDVRMATRGARVAWKDPLTVEQYERWFEKMFPISPKSTHSNDGEGTSAQTTNILEKVTDEKKKSKWCIEKNVIQEGETEKTWR